MPIRETISQIKHKRRAAALALAVLLAGALAAQPLLFGPKVKVCTVERRELLQTVVATGRVETPLRVDIGSQVTGVIAAIPVAAGQAVKRGQVLIELERDEAAAAVEQARAAVGQAQARLLQLRQVGGPVAALAQAEVALQMARAKLGYTTIAAPAGGVLIARAAERGDVVQRGYVLMVLSPNGCTRLVVDIDEKNIALLRIGQAALASADAYPAQRFGVFDLMRRVSAENGTAFLFVTHNLAPAQRCDRIVELVDGRIVA